MSLVGHDKKVGYGEMDKTMTLVNLINLSPSPVIVLRNLYKATLDDLITWLCSYEKGGQLALFGSDTSGFLSVSFVKENNLFRSRFFLKINCRTKEIISEKYQSVVFCPGKFTDIAETEHWRVAAHLFKTIQGLAMKKTVELLRHKNKTNPVD